jgi:hypothetical protein
MEQRDVCAGAATMGTGSRSAWTMGLAFLRVGSTRAAWLAGTVNGSQEENGVAVPP